MQPNVTGKRSSGYTVEITGTEDKIKAFLTLVKPLGVKELVRTGSIAMIRGEKMIQVSEKEPKGGTDG
jgi:acetolactate synthase-1/3 small subunit